MINKFLKIRLRNYAITSLLLCFFAMTMQTEAQVTVDKRSASGEFSSTGVTTLSWQHTVGTGSNRALLVGISATNQVATAPICSPAPCPPLPNNPLPNTNPSALRTSRVTYNGVRMEVLSSDTYTEFNPDAGQQTILSTEIFLLVNPPSGTGIVRADFEPGFVTYASGNSVSFNGVNQAAPTNYFNYNVDSGNDNSPTVTVSGGEISAGDMVFDSLASTPNAGFFEAGADQTVCTDPSDETSCTRGRRFFFNAFDIGASSTEPGNTAGTTMSWRMLTAQPWIISAKVIKAALPVTAAGVSVGGRVTTTRGRGVARMVLKLTELDGSVRAATTNSFGYFRFENVGAGQNITLEGFSKQYRIVPQTINVYENIADLRLTIEP